MRCMSAESYLRIGELSRRTGVSVDLLRAWEKRYGLLEPSRSGGGFRLYSEADVARVEAMQHHLAAGLAAAEAARQTQRPAARERGAGAVEPAKDELAEALARFDDAAAHAVLDRLLATLSVEAVLAQVVLPYLHELGEAWERGDASVAQEHFASALVRGRLLGLARGWGGGSGPHALLACPPGELHDLGLIAFGLALRGHGWQITYLGQDTPLEAVAEEAERLLPHAVVLAFTRPGAVQAAAIAPVAKAAPTWLAGSGASGEFAEEAGARLLSEDPVTAAARVATT
jgi:DNA-binding transcriptional MerR regulator